jgi:hypothetical protein
VTRLAGLALRVYPPSFRARYGQELTARVEDVPDTPKATADLFLGAFRTWIRPPFPNTERRLQATTATTWVAWCTGFLVAPAINRALLDPPTSGASGSVRTLLTISYALFFAGWALVLLGAAPVVLRLVIPAVRARTWSPLRPLIPVLMLGLLEAIGLLWLGLTSTARSEQVTHPSGLFITATVLWLIGFAAFICSLGVGPAMTLSRLEPDAPVLRNPTRLTAAVAFTLTALTCCSLAATLLAGDATLANSALPVAFALGIGCLASVTAIVSSSRGIHALRST